MQTAIYCLEWLGHKSNVKFGVVQSKQLSTNDLAVFDLDAVMIMCVESGSQIHGIHNIKTAGSYFSS